MKILILHHNFPGQFKSIAEYCVEKGWDVTFLCQTNFGKTIEGVTVKVLGMPSKKNRLESISSQLNNAQQYREVFEELRREGYYPDIVISHSGWGCGLYAKSEFTKTKLISYSEWWFKHDSEEYSFKNDELISYTDKTKNLMYLRNLATCTELIEADEIVCPTKWQRDQHPNKIKESIKVIHEGIDTDFFVYNKDWKRTDGVKTITYATRGMEPMRGFPEMIIAMKKILDDQKNIKLVIAGEDKNFYGGNKIKNLTYGKWAEKILYNEIKDNRVKFTGRLPLQKYARLLKMSDLHIYFSRPFVVSWSLLEAMSSGCNLIASDVAPVKEILEGTQNQLVDHRKMDDIISGIQTQLDKTDHERRLAGQGNRQKIVNEYSRRMSLEKWGDLLGN